MNVLITGGSGKIGSQLALDIAKKGWVPILADVNRESLSYVSKRLEERNHYCVFSDITTREGIEKCIIETINKITFLPNRPWDVILPSMVLGKMELPC